MHQRKSLTNLFAALNTIDGKVIGDCMPLHRHQEFIRFLRRIDQETPKEFELHLIVDNYATHKHPGVERWLRRMLCVIQREPTTYLGIASCSYWKLYSCVFGVVKVLSIGQKSKTTRFFGQTRFSDGAQSIPETLPNRVEQRDDDREYSIRNYSYRGSTGSMRTEFARNK